MLTDRESKGEDRWCRILFIELERISSVDKLQCPQWGRCEPSACRVMTAICQFAAISANSCKFYYFIHSMLKIDVK